MITPIKLRPDRGLGCFPDHANHAARVSAAWKPDLKLPKLPLPQDRTEQNLTAESFIPVKLQTEQDCVTKALSAAMLFRIRLDYPTLPYFELDEETFYYGARWITGMGMEKYDAGCYPSMAIKFAYEYGVPVRTRPPDSSRVNEMPPDEIWNSTNRVYLKDDGFKFCMGGFDEIIGAAWERTPVCMRFTVFEKFYRFGTDDEGRMPEPTFTADDREVGSHYIVVIGFNWKWKQALLCRNSWGTDFGIRTGVMAQQYRGHFYMPFDFAKGNGYYTGDPWAISGVRYTT